MSKLDSYLKILTNEKLVSDSLAGAAQRWWQQADSRFDGQLPVPSAAPGPDGQLLYSWDKDENHIEVEFLSCEPATLFHMNRITGDAAEHVLGERLQPEDTELFLPFLNYNPKDLPESGLAATH